MRNKESLNRLLNIMRKFGKFSLLYANVGKCEACWIGRSECRTDKPVNGKVTSLIRSSIKIIGVHYSYKGEVAEDKNFSDLTKSMKTVLNIWRPRYLTLRGKIQVFKSLVASKPVYFASMKSVPSYVVDSMQALHKDFIWNDKKTKIKHTTLISDYTHGGLKDITRDLKHDDAFNTTWPPGLSIDKCCQVTSLSIERTDHHVPLKASSCLRRLILTAGRFH